MSLCYEDPTTACLVLKGLMRLLTEREKMRGRVELERVERLQQHENSEVFKLTEVLIDNFFSEEFG